MKIYESARTVSKPMVIVQSRFMSQVYTWMASGILVTAIIASYIGTSPEWRMQIMTNSGLMTGLLIAQLAVVLFLTFAINKISAFTATITYFVYAALTGVTFASIFVAYTQSSIASVFFTTTFAFGGLSAYGFITKRDLSGLGTFCLMGLFGLLGWGLLSLFFPSMMGGYSGLIYSLIGVGIFSGLTAYDTQKIKAMGVGLVEGSEGEKKGAIFGALMLYLDFINLFLFLLRLMGGRRD